MTPGVGLAEEAAATGVLLALLADALPLVAPWDPASAVDGP
jgi:hypothetical protein